MSGPFKKVGEEIKGKDVDSFNDTAMPEPQEYCETDPERVAVTDIPSLEPLDLKAPEGDHTPNHTRGPKQSKIGWNFQHGRGSGGVGL